MLPIVSLCDQHGRKQEIEVAPADSFDPMFKAFSEAVFDPSLRERLREAIEVRASYLELLGTQG